MLTRWFGSIPIWKKSARLRSELPSRPPVEICPVWLEWSVAWLTVKTGETAWPFTLSATNTFQCVLVAETGPRGTRRTGTTTENLVVSERERGIGETDAGGHAHVGSIEIGATVV